MADQDPILTDQEIQQLADLGVSQDQLENLKNYYASASQRRFSAAPQGRQAGNVYMAANPLEFIGHGIEQYRAGRQMQNLRDQQTQLLNQQAATRAAMLRQLNGQRPMVTNGPAMGPPLPPQMQQQRAQMLRSGGY